MTSTARAPGPAVVQGLPAGIVTRTVAAVVDVLVVLGAVAVVQSGYEALRYLLVGPPVSAPRLGLWGAVGFGSALAAVYLAGSWCTVGRTVGDQMMGLRVTGRSGARLTLVPAVLRAVLYLLFPLGLLWIPASRRRASVQDLLVGSAVLHDWYGHSRHRPGPAGSPGPPGRGAGERP
ncbi:MULTISPECIES: RDD family protein [unclassified Streptomyces]|uniref:RDD family protein n=1 Tax=unclassified Streptomyces TaxID=2593676 RepID=UPI00119D4609|nr:RDD family protein [Streptomyces sp. BK340]TVZ80719.1 RDD family protein [Streptomyces sp. BK340]